MHTLDWPNLIAAITALLTAIFSHYRLNGISEKVEAESKLAMAKLLADALIAAAKLKAEEKEAIR